MKQLIFTFSILIIGLASGYTLKILHEKKYVPLPIGLFKLRILLQKIGILGFLAGAFFLALWTVKLPDIRLSVMPLLCLSALVLGGALAYGCARLLRLTRQQTGALYCCGSFTNIGAIGGLICYVFLGEAGFALVPVYKLFEEMYYFTIGFSTAKSFGSDKGEYVSYSARLRKVLTDPFILCILAAIVLGTALNLSGVPRPAWCATLTAIMVPAGILCLLMSIGLAMQFSRITKYLREGICVFCIKSVCIPVVITGAAYLLGLGEILDGLPLRVILICSSMPPAFLALVPPSLYDLDLDLANACWAIGTGALLITLPVLRGVLQLMH